MEEDNVQENCTTNVPVTQSSQESQRYCWVCFATEEDDKAAQWVQPCLCRGSSKWVINTTTLFIFKIYSNCFIQLGASSLFAEMG